MIQFKKGHTTPEQSKKLLTLGVPADSADLQIPYIEYYDLSPSDNEKIVQYYEYLAPIFWDETEHGLLPKDKVVWEREFAGEKYDGHITEYIPCWSVGRLIVIYCTCRECTWEYITNNPPIEDILCDIELYIKELDFLKLN